jgi:S1-C subfamily serine protease
MTSKIKGVAILTIPSASPAEKAGFQGITKDSNGKTIPGDIIIKMDEMPIENNDELSHFLEQHSAGDQIDVTVRRKDKEIRIPYKLVKLP